jgi:hypothetical protein
MERLRPWNPINVRRYRLPAFLRLEVEGPDGSRYPARLAGRKVAGVCGPIARTVPVRLVPRRPLVAREREQAVGMVRILKFAGYTDVELDRVDRRPYEEQPVVRGQGTGDRGQVRARAREVCLELF